jgi:histone H3/H4
MAKKAVKKATGGKAKAKTGEMLLVVSKVKAALRDHNVNVASDAADALNQFVHTQVTAAAKRAQANGRKTVRAHDFLV